MKFLYALTATTLVSAAPVSKTLNIGLPPSIPAKIKSVTFIDEKLSLSSSSTIVSSGRVSSGRVSVISLKKDPAASSSSSSASSSSSSSSSSPTTSSTLPTAKVPSIQNPIPVSVSVNANANANANADPVLFEYFPHHRPRPATTDDYLTAFAANEAAHERHYADIIHESAHPHHRAGGPHHHHHHHHHHQQQQGLNGPQRYHACVCGWNLDEMVTSWMALPWGVRMFVWFSTCFGVSMIVVGAVAFVINLIRTPFSIRLEDIDEEADYPAEKVPLSISATGTVPESAPPASH